MKKLFISLGIALALCGGFAIADEAVLIDFSELRGDTQVGDRMMHADSMVDYSTQAGASFTEEEKQQMLVSLALDEWEVDLASSSQTVANMRYSMTKEVDSAKYEKVLGARIHFPSGDYNSWAMVRPPFEIPAYQHPTKYDETEGIVKKLTAEEIQQKNEENGVGKGEPAYTDVNSKFNGKGVLKNVGVLKEIKVTAYGSNFPHGLSIRYKDQTGKTHDVFMAHLNFDGWKELIWKNPNYIEEVRNRELRILPLYPQAFPFLKFIGFVLHRDGESIGSDFVVYFKKIDIIYDKAMLTLETDIDDEAAWGILNDREKARRTAEIKRVGNIQVLRFLENKKKALETFEETSEE